MRHTVSVSLCSMLCLAGPVLAQGTLNQLGDNKLVRGNLSHTMNWDSCQEYSWSVSNPVAPCGIDRCGKKLCLYVAPEYSINYWEPSEIIEVSCRNGYSMVAPGRIPTRGDASEKSPQSCFVPTGKGGRRWFFEARVWAINGYPGAAREQSSGGGHAEEARNCTEDEHDTTKGRYWGYGIKWDQFSRGSDNGPGGSWEGYISDNQESWAKDTGSAQAAPSQQACTGTSVENCWGPITRSGWVSHPNQAVAAALAGWRAHTIAQQSGRVSPPGSKGQYKMNLDYPFIQTSSPFARKMGFPGSSESSGFLGSKCFQPGDPGSSWYTVKELQFKPEEVPAFIQGLRAGDATAEASINSGVYVFTVWAYTACKRYGRPGDFKGFCIWNPSCTKTLPWGACKYKGES